MIKVVRKVVIGVAILMACSVEALAGTNGKEGSFDWNPVMNAIIQVESGGNPRAVSGNSCGAMQITPICVKQCNLILQEKKSKKRYTLNDRFDVQKSKEMFLLLQSVYNRANDVEHAIRSWNGGPHYSKRATQRYYEKVMRHMK
ncbi:MAG: transglycosylase SLT domain-containing protein [Prevotella sp.]|nr:transglycosylase SLT domain-containing protein [Prevotella sp.]